MKVYIKMVGCRLNQSEIDTMARQFEQLGHEIVDDPAHADHFVLNTCAVTNEATKTSRKLIREFSRVNPNGETTVTGCYAQIAPQDIQVLPSVKRVVNNQDKAHIVSQLTGEQVEIYDTEPFERDAMPGTLGRTRAFVKVQDGCDNACTFCVTTVARGQGQSRTIDDVVKEVNYLYGMGYQEAVLTGVHLGSFGYDAGDKDGLVHLVQTLLSDTDMPRIRLSSLEPWDLSDGFFDLWENPRLCRHLHLPLQSGCDATLKRMRRNTSQEAFGELMAIAREKIADVRITSDVIVGFPGETDEEFATSAQFIRDMNFAGLHVFRYSIRPGTPASRMRQQVSTKIKKQRSAQLLDLSNQMEADFAKTLANTTQSVLWEQITGSTPDGFINTGYTDNYMRVKAIHPRDLTNHITTTRLSDYVDGAINGVPVIE
jgi:threonylcarbamoyladenosine tRNA methylthiotransferase MtaB